MKYDAIGVSKIINSLVVCNLIVAANGGNIRRKFEITFSVCSKSLHRVADISYTLSWAFVKLAFLLFPKYLILPPKNALRKFVCRLIGL